MTDKKDFLAALAADEDDELARMAYSDWLEENGEPEEAERQRAWPAAKAWLVALAERYKDDGGDYDYRTETYSSTTDYEYLVELGHRFVREGYASVGSRESLQDELNEDPKVFFEKWSIVTGVPLTPSDGCNAYFLCAC